MSFAVPDIQAQSSQTLPAFIGTTTDSAKFALAISSTDNLLTITDPRSGRSWVVEHRFVQRDSTGLRLGDSIVVRDSAILLLGDTLIWLPDISSVHATREGKIIRLEFLVQKNVSPATRLRRGNLVRGLRGESVDSGRFIRGSVISLGGDIDIEGEVNRDVVSLTGNIRLTSSALVRGSVVSLLGVVTLDDGSRYYGEAMSGKPGRRKFQILASNRFGLNPLLTYDRVDGLTFGLGASYPNDTRRPWKFRGQMGYALASDRIRVDGGFSCRLNKAKKLTLSLDGYNRLAHDDDGLSTRLENTFLALAFKEDLWDWYEASGGALTLEMQPWPKMHIEAAYRREEIKWLPAHPNLWSFSCGSGGSHLFWENFLSVAPSSGNDLFDSFSTNSGKTSIGELRLSASYLKSVSLRNYEGSGFALDAWGDLSGTTLGGDNSYQRFGLSLRRYQQIDRNIQGMVRFSYAGSGDRLPLYRIYSLGGFATLPGYRLREFACDQFILAKAELRFALRSRIAAFSLLADAARTRDALNGQTATPSDIGLRLYFSAFAHLTAAAPIGAGNDGQVRYWLSFRHNF